jgi:hypothetical protein
MTSTICLLVSQLDLYAVIFGCLSVDNRATSRSRCSRVPPARQGSTNQTHERSAPPQTCRRAHAHKKQGAYAPSCANFALSTIFTATRSSVSLLTACHTLRTHERRRRQKPTTDTTYPAQHVQPNTNAFRHTAKCTHHGDARVRHSHAKGAIS